MSWQMTVQIYSILRCFIVAATIVVLRGGRFCYCAVGLAAIFAGCRSDGQRDISAYYFPVDKLRGGRVYEYASREGNASISEYWYYRSFQRDSGQFISATFYDRNFQIGQIAREKVTDAGIVARDYFLYEPDEQSGKQIKMKTVLESPMMYPFHVSDSNAVFQFGLQYHPAWDPEATAYIIRDRRFLGNAPDFELKGNKYPCIRFSVRESIGSKKGDPEVEGRGEEWYAKGIGLVYARKTYAQGAVKVENRLVDIFSMKELEKRAAEQAIY
jgi:hypothetical protein